MSLIELNLPVTRCEDGYWSNPAIPDFDEDAKAYKAWLDSQRLETTYKDLEFENDTHPAYIKYFENGSPDVSEWMPEPPEGEGWHTFSIHAHEDGVCWVWARRKIEDDQSEPIPITTVLADASHPAHAVVTDMVAKLESGEISLCGCMGPMYGEPHCICTMQRLGLPLNEAAREVARKRSEAQLDALFGPGGAFYKPPKDAPIASRNKREGKWTPEKHFRGIYLRSNNWPIWFNLTRNDRKQEWRSRNEYPEAP